MRRRNPLCGQARESLATKFRTMEVDNMIATRVRQGQFQVVECTPRGKGQTDAVEPISPWLPIPEHYKKLTEEGFLGSSYMLVKGSDYESLFEPNHRLIQFRKQAK